MSLPKSVCGLSQFLQLPLLPFQLKDLAQLPGDNDYSLEPSTVCVAYTATARFWSQNEINEIMLLNVTPLLLCRSLIENDG